MALRFQLSFAEEYHVVDGIHPLHLVCTAEEPATPRVHYTFDVSLASTTGKYSRRFADVKMPEGKTSVSIPFVPPLDWVDDFAENIGDLAHEAACGLFRASMKVHFVGYAGTAEFAYDYTGYAAQMPGGVPENIRPTVGRIAAQQADKAVPPAWGIWVQGKSLVKLTVPEAAGARGSRIISWRFGHGSEQTHDGAELPLPQAGRVDIPVTVTDSRLRMATADISLVVQPYQPPSLSAISSSRCQPDGTPSENGSAFLPRYTLLYSGLGGHNTASVSCRWKKVTQSEYGPARVPVPGQAMAAALEKETSYDVQYTVTDAFGSIEYFDYISSTVYLLHFLKGGTGIAVGKAAESGNLFDVGLDTRFRRDASVGGDLSVTGQLKLGGKDVAPLLRSLQQVESRTMTVQPCMSELTANQAAKYGRLVLSRLEGVLTDGGEMPFAGMPYHLATLPAGWFSTRYPTMVTASQNGLPCYGYVTEAGEVYVMPNKSGLQNTRVDTIGIVE